MAVGNAGPAGAITPSSVPPAANHRLVGCAWEVFVKGAGVCEGVGVCKGGVCEWGGVCNGVGVCKVGCL